MLFIPGKNMELVLKNWRWNAPNYSNQNVICGDEMSLFFGN